MLFQLQLPVDPRPTPRPRVSKFGAYYPKAYKDYQKQLKAAVVERWGEQPLIDYAVDVSILALCERPKTTKLSMPKPDWDNFGKGVCDAMNGVVLVDDSLIRGGTCYKAWAQSGEPGRIHVTIEPATPLDVLPRQFTRRSD